MASSDTDTDSGWNTELITAISKKPTQARIISEENRRKQMQDCLCEGADINTVDKNGNTALHIAVKRGYQRIVEFVLQNGASIDVPNRKGQTAITLAEKLGKREIANILKKNEGKWQGKSSGEAPHSSEHDSKVSKMPDYKEANPQEHTGFMPLHLVAREGQLDVVKYLLDEGANINCEKNTSLTPLHLAAQVGHFHVMKHLLNKEANINPQENTVLTPWYLARQKGKLDVVKYLLDQGTNINFQENAICCT